MKSQERPCIKGWRTQRRTGCIKLQLEASHEKEKGKKVIETRSGAGGGNDSITRASILKIIIVISALKNAACSEVMTVF